MYTGVGRGMPAMYTRVYHGGYIPSTMPPWVHTMVYTTLLGAYTVSVWCGVLPRGVPGLYSEINIDNEAQGGLSSLFPVRVGMGCCAESLRSSGCYS